MSENNFIFWQFKDETDQDNKIRDELLEFPAVSAGASDPSAGLTCDLHRENFASFLAAVDAKTPPPVSGREARKAVEIILAIYQSAQTGKVVHLPLKRSPKLVNTRTAAKKIRGQARKKR